MHRMTHAAFHHVVACTHRARCCTGNRHQPRHHAVVDCRGLQADAFTHPRGRQRNAALGRQRTDPLKRIIPGMPRQIGGAVAGRQQPARAEIERWRREYNEERPKKSLGGLTPAAYAQQLAVKPLR